MRRTYAVILVAVSAVLWGFIGVCTRHLSGAGLSAIQINALRGFVCTAVLFLALLAFDRKAFRIEKRHVLKFVLLAAVKILMDICFIKSQTEVDLSLAGILLSTDSFFVLFISYFMFRSSMTPAKIAAVFVGFFGCTLVMNLYAGVDSINFVGVLYGLGSGVFGAFYSVGLKVVMNDGYEPYAMLFFLFLIGSVIYLPIMDVPSAVSILSGSSEAVGYLFLMGLVFTLLPYYLYTVGLKHLEPLTVVILLFLEAATSAAAGVVFFSEEMNGWMILGMALVLAATILMELKPKGTE